MKFVATVCLPLVMIALLGSGCATGIKEGVGLARGAKGSYAPLKDVSASENARPLGEYQRFELGTFTDDFGGKVPPAVMQACRAAWPKELEDKELPNAPGGKTLIARGIIIHYEASGTLGKVIGPIEEVVARTELVDKDSGKVIATGNCVGRTTTRVNLGADKKGQGLAKAIASWIADRYPEPTKE